MAVLSSTQFPTSPIPRFEGTSRRTVAFPDTKLYSIDFVRQALTRQVDLVLSGNRGSHT